VKEKMSGRVRTGKKRYCERKGNAAERGSTQEKRKKVSLRAYELTTRTNSEEKSVGTG